MPPDGHVFISYSRRDGNEQAEKVEQALRAKHFGVWRDVRNLNPEQDFTADIETGIEAAAYVVVCITKDAKRDNSFVRREIQYALAVNKPVIPLRFEDVPPHVSIINNEWVDFFRDWDKAFRRLIEILSGTSYANQPGGEIQDPFKPYLQYLLQRVTDYLKQAVIRKINLSAEATPDAVPEMRVERSMLDLLFDGLPIGSKKRSETTFTTFGEGFNHYKGSVLLLGEPGAGKTVTLMAHARDAIAARLDDPTLPLPLLGLVATWDAKEQPSLAHWLAGAYPGLLNETDVQAEIAAGKTLLLLDGLDELGSEREDETTKEHYDPRLRFVQTLTSNPTLITCRVKDYEEIGVKIPLNGAITLKPLDDAQMQMYLRDYGDLWDLLQMDEQLREVARIPLLLSYFAFAVQDLSESERAELTNLKDLGDIRDKIFQFYVEKRYAHEAVKYRANGKQMPFTLAKIYEGLGHVAMDNASVLVYTRSSIYGFELARALALPAADIQIFLKFVLNLNLITIDNKNLFNTSAFRFVHVLLRDYFAYQYASPKLTSHNSIVRWRAADTLGKLKDKRAIGNLIAALSDADSLVRETIAETLGNFQDTRVIEPLLNCLNDNSPTVRVNAAYSLGNLRAEIAVKAITNLLNDLRDIYFDADSVTDRVIGALEKIGTPEALAAVYIWKNKEVRKAINDLNANDIETRILAISILGKFGDENTITLLVKLLTDDTEYDSGQQICDAAAEALEAIGTPEALAAVEAWKAGRKD